MGLRCQARLDAAGRTWDAGRHLCVRQVVRLDLYWSSGVLSRLNECRSTTDRVGQWPCGVRSEREAHWGSGSAGRPGSPHSLGH